MYLLNIIGKIFGIGNIIKNDNKKEKIVITIDDSNTATSIVVENKKYKVSKYFLYLSNILYVSVIFLLTTFDCFTNIYLVFKKLDYRYFISGFIGYNFIFQYSVSLHYFRKLKNIQYSRYISLIWLMSLAILCIYQISWNILLFTNVKVFMYSEILNNDSTIQTTVSLVFFSNISKIIGYAIFLLNSIIFSFVFIYHTIVLGKYVKKIKRNLSNYEANILSIDSIIEEYLTIKDDYTKDVSKLNDIFAGATISLFILSYNIALNINNFFESKHISFIHFADISVIIVIECIHLIVISKINSNIRDLRSLIFGKKFVNYLLSKQETENIYSDEQVNDNDKDIVKILKKTKQIKDISTKSLIYSAESLRKLDWISLVKIIGEEWEPFNILGFIITDSTRIKQIIGIIGSIIMFLTLLRAQN